MAEASTSGETGLGEASVIMINEKDIELDPKIEPAGIINK